MRLFYLLVNQCIISNPQNRPVPQICRLLVACLICFAGKLSLLCVIWERALWREWRGDIADTRPWVMVRTSVFQEIFCPTRIMNNAGGSLHFTKHWIIFTSLMIRSFNIWNATHNIFYSQFCWFWDHCVSPGHFKTVIHCLFSFSCPSI